MSREIKYHYLVVRHNGHRFGRVFTLDEIEVGDANGWLKANNVGEYHRREYTGLHDRAGREIYEGDLIQSRNRDYMAEVYYDERTASFRGRVDGEMQFDKTMDLVMLSHLGQVVGNIHEQEVKRVNGGTE